MSNNGKAGENLFAQLMEEKGYTVIDVSDNPDYFDKDIDFIITSPTSGLTKTFEVKWDSKIHKSGNLYLETSNIHSKGGKGWLQFCQADYIAYGDAINKTFYIIPFKELKKLTYWKYFKNARCGDDSEGILVSLEDIAHLYQEVK